MFRTPYNSRQQLRLKSGSESGGWGGSCRKFLATVWAIAIGEPTPAGEIVAAVATVIVGGVLLYEIIACSSSSSSSDHSYCLSKFETCRLSSTIPYNQCEQCYRYCMAQGYWNCY